MWIYSHTNYVLRGYSGLTHEAIVFTQDQEQEVPEAVGRHLLGSHPLQFCTVPGRCPHGYAHGMMEEPPAHRMMMPRRRRGRPLKDRNKVKA